MLVSEKEKNIKIYFVWIYAKLIAPKINLVKVIYFIISEKLKFPSY